MSNKLPSLYSVIRECFLQLDNPEHADLKKILAMSRAKWTQLGGDPDEVDVITVNNCRARMRARLQQPLTKEKIQKYHDSCKKLPRSNKLKKGDRVGSHSKEETIIDSVPITHSLFSTISKNAKTSL